MSKIKRMKDKSTDWRVGVLYIKTFDGRLIDTLSPWVTIRPGQSARKREREIAKDKKILSEQVLLAPQGDWE